MEKTRVPRLALFEPDIPQNAGAILRLAACLGAAVDVIEPCGFVWSEAKMRRAGMDYMKDVELVLHESWEIFADRLIRDDRRLVLLSTSGEAELGRFAFSPRDTLLLGRESAGVPEKVREFAAIGLRIPMRPGMRSLNVAQAAAMVLWEAVRPPA